MNTMKKLVAMMLVLTMVLALTATAMAACKWEKYQIVKFTKNTVAYNHKEGKASSTIVRKGSFAMVKRVCGDWVELYLNPVDDSVTRWFKTDNLKADSRGKKIGDIYFGIWVVYCQGGVGKSSELMVFNDEDPVDEEDFGDYRISADCYKHVKATAKVWLHKEASLKKNYGKALRKDDKVTYRRVWALDDRLVPFYGVKYEGKCLWVSALYSKIVK